MKKYKLFPINRYILLGEWDNENICELYENKPPDYYLNEENLIMTINKNQCTKIIRRFGKDYYKIKA